MALSKGHPFCFVEQFEVCLAGVRRPDRRFRQSGVIVTQSYDLRNAIPHYTPYFVGILEEGDF